MLCLFALFLQRKVPLPDERKQLVFPLLKKQQTAFLGLFFPDFTLNII